MHAWPKESGRLRLSAATAVIAPFGVLRIAALILLIRTGNPGLSGQTAVSSAITPAEPQKVVVSASGTQSQTAEPNKPNEVSTPPKADVPSPTTIVEGRVRSGNTAVPGATVAATDTRTGQKFTTWTQVDGSYKLSLPPGDYSVRAQMVAFAPATQPLKIGAASAPHQLDFHIILNSRAESPAGNA